jgi:hypothetical protein
VNGKHSVEGLPGHPQAAPEAQSWQSFGTAGGYEPASLFIGGGPADPKDACGLLNREHNGLFWGHGLHLLS